jgi:bifunctional non-homologous end joining protein LigD
VLPEGGLNIVRAAAKVKPTSWLNISHGDLMQPGVANGMPSGGDWVFELKYDGFRCLAIRDSRRVRLLTRDGNDLARCFPEVVLEFRNLPGEVVLDGELVVLDERGRPQFERLCRRARMSRGLSVMDASKRDPAALLAFDILWCERIDQRNKTLLERKRALSRLVRGTERIRVVSHVDVGPAAYHFAVQMELEGIVAKKLGSYYVAGSSMNWLKFEAPTGKGRERLQSGIPQPA